MEDKSLSQRKEENLNAKIDILFRRSGLSLQQKKEYFRQAREYAAGSENNSLKKFSFMPPVIPQKQTQTPDFQISLPNESKANDDPLTFHLHFGQNGDAKGSDNRGNTLEAASPQEMFKQIVEQLKQKGAQGAKLTRLSGEHNEEISQAFARECVMGGIAPHGDLPQDPGFWPLLKAEFLADKTRTVEEWNKLTGHIAEASEENKKNQEQNKNQSADSQKPNRAEKTDNKPKPRQEKQPFKQPNLAVSQNRFLSGGRSSV